MSSWRALAMRDLMIEFHDGPHATPSPVDDGPVYLGIKNITDQGALDLRDIRRIAESDFARWTRRVTPQPGDVVFTYEATLHRYAMIPEGFRGCLGRRIALIRPDQSVVLPRFLHLLMLGPVWRETINGRIISGSTVDRIPIIDFPNFPIEVPDLGTQRAVVNVLGSIDDLIENNRRRVEVLEEMARAIYREWFVHFRFPGHEDATFVDSPLGPIPEGWAWRTVASLASAARYGVTGGPFGSKLGRKDYRESGVPVVRGANLRVGGGFDERDLVFVAEEKADELRSCLAHRGDVLVTQRGTLGQVGLIPSDSGFDRYLLSQSQMKISVDSSVATPEFVYNQFRSPETTDRFISQAMSSGVPHVNLTLLREFELLLPPGALVEMFTEHVRCLDAQGWALRRQTDRLVSMRSLLLPKLVTGQIDVSSLDLDAVIEASVA